MSKRAAYIVLTLAQIALVVALIVVLPTQPAVVHAACTIAVVLVAIITDRAKGWAVRKISRPETPKEK